MSPWGAASRSGLIQLGAAMFLHLFHAVTLLPTLQAFWQLSATNELWPPCPVAAVLQKVLRLFAKHECKDICLLAMTGLTSVSIVRVVQPEDTAVNNRLLCHKLCKL